MRTRRRTTYQRLRIEYGPVVRNSSHRLIMCFGAAVWLLWLPKACNSRGGLTSHSFDSGASSSAMQNHERTEGRCLRGDDQQGDYLRGESRSGTRQDLGSKGLKASGGVCKALEGRLVELLVAAGRRELGRGRARASIKGLAACYSAGVWSTLYFRSHVHT